MRPSLQVLSFPRHKPTQGVEFQAFRLSTNIKNLLILPRPTSFNTCSQTRFSLRSTLKKKYLGSLQHIKPRKYYLGY